MTVRGFIFLMVITVASVIAAGLIAERYTQPGFERTVWVGILTALVVFPSARWAEKRGWIKGNLELDKLKDEFSRKPQDPNKKP